MTRTSDPLVGCVLDGRYEILDRIARGGMATVYVAHDRRLMRQCAIKVMHEGLVDDADFTHKFDREARAAARLTHPHVVAVFDQGRDLGRPYIVMEYVPGTTLRQLISREAPLAPLRALELLEPVLSALAAAHRAGLVHRDVKPENVLISQRGQVKVADFGLARAISGDTATATQGLLIGTVSYIPPELVMSGRADARSDVYSAGVVLFEMLTGRKPHTGDSPIQVAYAHCNTDIVPPSTLVPVSWRDSRGGIPPYLDALVGSAVSRDPAGRPRDAGAFLDRLRVAAHALERGVMDDRRLDAQMRGAGNVGTAEQTTAVAPVPPPAHVAAPPVSRWVAGGRSMRATPQTPISPVDLPTLGGAVGIPFYDDVQAEVTPVRTPAPVVVRPRPRPRGATVAPRRRPRRRWAPLVALLTVLLIATTAAYGSWYALAGQYTTVPVIAGMTVDKARAHASESGVRVTFTDEFSETVPRGTVIRTDPASGARVHQESEMVAVVSKGPERVEVPRLLGLGLDDAEARLRAAGLAPGEITRRYDENNVAGVVIDAGAPAGTRVKRDATVDLTVSRGPRPLPIASYVGRDAGSARAALRRQGFRVETTSVNDKVVKAGAVISQSPDQGEGHRGDTIRLTVSKGPVMVTVPNTRKMRVADATRVIQQAGFTVAVTKLPNPMPLDIVAYSTPEGAGQAPEGSTVTIFVV